MIAAGISRPIARSIVVTRAGVTTDSDAQDFFVRSGITNNTQKNAVNNLVLSLKSANIWTKMRALYPFVGGTASTHAQNLKSTSYTVTWDGAVHNANGITGNGNANNTGLLLSSTTPGSIAYGAYNKTAAVSTATFSEDVGCVDYPLFYTLLTRYSDNTFVGRASAENPSITVTGVTDARGFHVISRQSMTLYKAFRNGVQYGTTQTDIPVTPLPAALFYLGSTHTLALAFISDGLSDAECSQFNAIVEIYETSLGRQNP